MICVIQAPFIYKKRKFKRRSVQDAVVLISTRFLLGMIRPLTFLSLYIFSREMGTAWLDMRLYINRICVCS